MIRPEVKEIVLLPMIDDESTGAAIYRFWPDTHDPMRPYRLFRFRH